MIPENLRLSNHYTVFIYPFFYNIREKNRDSWIRSLARSWDPWWSRLGNEIGSALDNTYFFLPYIREVLFPETAIFKDKPPGKDYENWINEIVRWNKGGLSCFCQELSPNAVLRATYKQTYLQQLKQFEVVERADTQTSTTSIAARIDWIDAVLFPSGIGFLMLKIVLDRDSPQLNHLVDLNYSLRLVHPPNTAWILPEIRFGGQAHKNTVRDLMDFLTQAMVSEVEQIDNFAAWKATVSDSKQIRLSETESGQVYGERCNIFSYACVNVEENELGRSSTGVFDSLKDRLVFEYASSIEIGDSVNNTLWTPSTEQVQRLKTDHQISVWKAWTGMALKESVVFLGTEDISFNRNLLPANVENDYLPLYVYTLYQKYQLFIFADQLMRKGAYVAEHLNEVRVLMDRFMDFRNKYWFNEVTRKPLGGELYTKFQRGLESISLFDLVTLQVKDLKEYYEERRQRRIDVVLNVFTFLFIPIGAAIGVFGMTFFEGSWMAFIITMVIILTISVGIWRWWTGEFGPHIE